MRMKARRAQILIGWMIVCGMAAASSLYDTTVLSNDPVEFLPLDNTSGTTATNLSTTTGAQNGTENDVTLGVTGGPDGHGIGFTPASTSEVSVPNYSALDVTTQFSVEVWVDVPSSTANSLGTIFAINRATNSTGISLALTGLTPLIALNSNGVNYSENSASSLIAGQWNQIVVTWSGGAPTFYINGVETANVNSNTFTQPLTLSTTIPNSIGAEFPGLGTSGGRFFDGSIEDISFYNKVLTPGEVAADFNAATAPEPASMLLFAGGLGIVGLVRRMRS